MSGLLVEKIGGPPVYTYDIPESFKPAPAGKGEALYRRSVYTFWRRTGPAPMLEAFDVPKRVVCVARRDTTNTSLQALVLLNGPQFVEASRVLAEKLLKEQTTDAARIDQLSILLLSRPATAKEQQIFAKSLAAFRADYAAKPAEAAKLLKAGEKPVDPKLPPNEVAAWTLVCSQMFNRDETLNK